MIVLFLILFSLLAASCGPTEADYKINPATTSCSPGAAEITIGDGFLRRTCGCTELTEQPETTTFKTSGIGMAPLLTCTVAPGTHLFFEFLGTTLKHQIIPLKYPMTPLADNEVGNAFVPSPISNPADRNPVRFHPIPVPTTPGTYPFADIFSGMQGEIIVP